MFEKNYDAYSPSKLQVLLYAQFLANSFKNPRSVKNYLSGARTFLRTRGYAIDSLCHDRINSVFKGNARLSTHVPRQAPAIDLEALRDLSSTLAIMGDEFSGERAAFLCMYASGLRQSNIAGGGLALGLHAVRSCDLHLDGATLWIDIFSSKTITSTEGAVSLPVEVAGGRHCPVAAWLHHLAVVPRDPLEPAFLLPRRTGMSPAYLVKLLRDILKLSGVPNYHSYTLHSFRRTTALEAARAGVPVEDVQALGTWSSSSVYDYAPRRVFTSASASLARSLAFKN